MKNTLQIKRFDYGQEDEVNEFIKTVDLPANGAIHFRDNGIIIVHTNKRTQHGLTREEHIESIQDEIAKAEAEMSDSLLQLEETRIGFENFNGKRGAKKVAEAFLSQMSKDTDTVQNRAAKLRSLRILYSKIESGEIKFGAEAMTEYFDGFAKEPEPEEANEVTGVNVVEGPTNPEAEEKTN